MTLARSFLVFAFVVLGGAILEAGGAAASEGKKETDANAGATGAGQVNFADPEQLLAHCQRGEQPCDWESYEDGQVLRCEVAVDGAVQLVVKATGRIYDSLKKGDPTARRALDAGTAAWWKYFKQCDLFAPDPSVLKENGQLAHHGAAGRCRYGILADRLRELLEFEELVKSHRKARSAKR